MSYEVQIAPAAQRQIKKLAPDVLPHIIAALDLLADDPRPGGVKKLKGEENVYRIRVKDYRILYEIYDDALIVIVVTVGHRRDVYR